MKAIGVIPARYKSSRFPGKPLMDICGRPMVWWTYHQAAQAKCLSEVYVATEDERVANVCKEYSIPVIMTSDKHENGTERLTEVARKIPADCYVTIQGDDPLIETAAVEKVLQVLLDSDDVGCVTLKTPYKNPVDVINGTTPKVVCDCNDNILLFTRSAVPYPKASLDYVIYKPIGVYAFRRDTLLKYADLKKGPLEKAEDIELLRFIEHGVKVKVKEIVSDTISVDTPKDLERVRNIVRNKLEKWGGTVSNRFLPARKNCSSFILKDRKEWRAA